MKKINQIMVAGFACTAYLSCFAQVSPLGVRKVYPDTSMTKCPGKEVLDHFFYSEDIPGRSGGDWCGAPTASTATQSAGPSQPNNKPIWMTGCDPGNWWTYAHGHLDDPSYRFDSPRYAGVSMVCWAKPDPPEPDPPKPNPPEPDTGKTCPGAEANKSEPSGARSRSLGLSAGNPIIPGTGEKVLDEQDYAGAGPHALAFVRSYRSQWAAGTKGTVVDPGLSPAWSHNHAVSLKLEGVTGTADSTARVMFGDGRVRAFAWNVAASAWTASNSSDSLAPGTLGLVYKSLDDDSVWQFDADGRLLSQTRRNGWTTSYSYSTPTTTSSTAPVAGLLTSVTNQFGATLTFTYNTAAQLVSVGMPDGQAIGFQYSSYNVGGNLWRLDAVIYPGASGTVSKHYLYENTNYPKLLTGIVDELGNRFATYAYDMDGRGISTQHAGGADLYTISYAAGGVATVTDPLGTPRTYNYGTNKGKLAVTSSSQPGGSTAGSVQDANGFVTQETDFLGVSTMYTWDINRRLPLSTTQAATLPEARTTSTQWHASFRLPVLVTEAGRTTAYSYDIQGNKLSQTVTDTASNVARTTSWTYNPQGLVATESANGIVRQTYAYYTATSFSGTVPNEVGYTAGDLQSITNAAGHVTQINMYDKAGRVRQMADPKGVVTDIAYTPRGWVSSTSVTPPGGTARTTTYSYDNAGQLIAVALPDTTTMSYSYDLAHRLKGVTDAKGNTVAYTLDAIGNKVGEQVKDPQGNLQRNITRVYDSLNRVRQVTGAVN